MKHNGSVYAHVFFARSGYTPDPSDPEYQPLAAFGRIHRKYYVSKLSTDIATVHQNLIFLFPLFSYCDILAQVKSK